MPIKAKIALYEPSSDTSGRYFSFKLKRHHHIEQTEFPAITKLLIISNIRGDFQYLRELLIHNKVINNANHWTFGNGHLVIAGNCFEENGTGVECLWLIYALEERAIRRGGYVHFILGKNELKNLNGSWQYMHPKYVISPKTTKAPYAILYDGNRELSRWLKTKNIIEKIGNIIISFSDISNEPTINKSSLSQLNFEARKYHVGSSSLHRQPLIPKILDNKNALQKITIKKNNEHTYISTDEDEPSSKGKKKEMNVLLVKNNHFYRINSQRLLENSQLSSK
jgi:hypothetical protein